jgi:dTDP-4-amino-4,6-dideoxygalactose transaminase
MAGLTPVFADVEPDTGSLTPDIALAALDAHPDLAAVVVVSPFGHPVPPAPWEEFQRRTGVPVVIDAAAAFDTLTPSTLPAVVSLHATKPLGCGEGGFLLSLDTDLVARILTRSNFGFDSARRAQNRSLNGKMSEYHAAVALAALDAWPATRDSLLDTARPYRTALEPIPSVRLPHGWGRDWISSTLVVRLIGGRDLVTLRGALDDLGIETRRWWEDGCHAHPAFAGFPRLSLEHTTNLAADSLGLPFSPDISQAEIVRVAGALGTILASIAP